MNKENKKQKDFVNELVKQKTKDPVKAIADSDHTILTVESAQKLSKDMMKQPAVRQMLDRILDTETLLERHRDLLDQKQTIVTYDSKNGQVIEETTDIADPDIILKALDMSYKLKGMYAPEQHENINVNLNARAKDNPRIGEITEEFEEKLREMFEKGKNNNKQNDTTNNTVS